MKNCERNIRNKVSEFAKEQQFFAQNLGKEFLAEENLSLGAITICDWMGITSRHEKKKIAEEIELFEKEIKKDAIEIQHAAWKFHNLAALIVSVVIAVLILQSSFLYNFISQLGTLEYLGVFIAGSFFSYGLTTAPAIAMLFIFGTTLNPIAVALIGGLGAVCSDYLIFRFIRNGLVKEIKTISKEFNIHMHLKKRYVRILRKIAPFVAGLIIASPLPDEIGVAIFGSMKYSTKYFLLFSYIANSFGILLIAVASKII